MNTKSVDITVRAFLYFVIATLIIAITTSFFSDWFFSNRVISASVFSVFHGVLISVGYYLISTRSVFKRKTEVDYLTSLNNRQCFSNDLELMTHNESNNFFVLLMDLDRFKTVNDTLGHGVGDKLLVQVASRLKGCIRPEDSVYRLGGDEFAIILDTPSVDIFNETVAEITRQIELPFFIELEKIAIGISIGAAVFPIHDISVLGLTKKADIAMYAAKKGKLKAKIYDIDDEETSIEELNMMSSMKEAIANKEFELFYQPKVKTDSDTVIGVEALIRWNRGGTIIPPNKFIHLAEQTNLINDITEFVIQQSIEDHKILKENGFDIEMSINVSANNLNDSRIMRTIVDGTCAQDVDPNRIIMEVTETAIMSDPDTTLKVLVGLDSLGISLSIDDFGTGHFSLLYLKNLPIKEIKIDRTFIRQIDSNKHDYNIVKSIVALAHNTGSRVVAEGIETEKVYDIVKSIGCDCVQGYYILKPVPLEEIIEWLKEHK